VYFFYKITQQTLFSFLSYFEQKNDFLNWAFDEYIEVVFDAR